ncbi:MAG TPA: glycosyl transferase family 1 [Acholeplasmataceae bacterium]|nr:glycosyl transferase family 1 [Acholeplasmataceae bacterium]
MKILIYTGLLKIVNKSGVGEAVRHQKRVLELLNLPCTSDIRDGFDIIHLNTIFPDSLIISKLAKRKKKKVIYYAHSTMEDFQNSFRGSNWIAPLFKKWITYCYNSGDLIITPTNYSKELLQTYEIVVPIYSLSNGVDTNFFNPEIERRVAFREKYHIDNNQKVIISVGHYIERKGILDFVKLAKEMPQYQFYWFGYTNLSLVTKEVKDAIQTKLSNLHFPGYVNRCELRDAYNGADLFLFLTNEETEGIVLLEALATKIPILVRDIPIYSDWLTDNETVYKAKHLQEFKERITQLLEGHLPDLTDAGYQIALQRDLRKIGQQLLAIYKR